MRQLRRRVVTWVDRGRRAGHPSGLSRPRSGASMTMSNVRAFASNTAAFRIRKRADMDDTMRVVY